MGDRLFVSEYVEGTRTAQWFQRLTEQDYVVYCFCCGHEAESEPFDTEYDAAVWAARWCNHQEELEVLEAQVGPEGCGCNDH